MARKEEEERRRDSPFEWERQHGGEKSSRSPRPTGAVPPRAAGFGFGVPRARDRKAMAETRRADSRAHLEREGGESEDRHAERRGGEVGTRCDLVPGIPPPNLGHPLTLRNVPRHEGKEGEGRAVGGRRGCAEGSAEADGEGALHPGDRSNWGPGAEGTFHFFSFFISFLPT